MFPEFSLSEKYQKTYPEVGFGLTLISGCREAANPEGFTPYRKKLLRKMRKRETLAQITQRIETYNAFFHDFGYACPLTRHLKRTVNSGFPLYSLFVDAHFMAEMCAGILVAVTDADTFEGGLTLDVAEGGETCDGMGGRLFTMQQKEIVLRDEKDIVCVLCQGADEKTRVKESTTSVLFYAYAVPGIDNEHLEFGLTIAAETLAEFGGGKIEGIKIY
ncbi:MAG: phenylalanine--tRNA ligase beta subunit-related protein [Thermodesulfobacteriota bacterium]